MVDGPGGAGKSTTVQHLHRYLSANGFDVHATTEPSRAPLGELARHHTATYKGHALACLVAADRYHHLCTEIRPALAAGRIVLCDRYVPSSYVLQCIDGVPFDFVEAINAPADIPDLAVLLTATPDAVVARIQRRGAHGRFEQDLISSRAEVDLYRQQCPRLRACGYPLLIIDTTHTPPEQVAELIARHINDLAGRPPSETPTA
jgi:dTMP kinase